MILGQDSSGSAPTAANPVPFQPPAATRAGHIPRMPHPRFMSTNIWPFSQVLNPMRAFPAYRPHLRPDVGPHGFPPTPAAPAATVAAPVPAITATAPGGTSGFGGFGGSGFGSHGGVKHHMHVDPYMVMRGGFIPGVHPSGSNIRAGYRNAKGRVMASMPFQSRALPPPPPPPPPPAPMPAATHGLGFPFRREFRRPGYVPGGYQQPGFPQPGMPFHHRHHHHHFQPAYVPPPAAAPVPAFGHHHHRHHHHEEMAGFGAPDASGCEWVGPRIDGISVKICNGRVVSYRDAQGNVTTPDDFQGPGREGWFMRNFGWRRRHHRHAA